MRIRRTSYLYLAAIVALLIPTGCATITYRFQSDPDLVALLAGATRAFPDARFAVISDLHVYDTGLGTDGEAFAEYLAHDRKLLVESLEILEVAIEKIRESGAEFVIVPGDLTKDGEHASHTLCAETLAGLEATGTQVYVVPGNHDVHNPHALSFSGDATEPVEAVDPESFAEIYRHLGYGEAIARDPSSLSYIVEPVEGLWLLALDSCDYERNVELERPVTAGRLRPEQIAWIEESLVEAARLGKGVLAVMHHGVVEHYAGQAKHFEEYVVADHEDIGHLFAAYGVAAVFTGHYHAQDIALGVWEEGMVYDIETGSLVTYPCPIRFVSIADGHLSITSSRIREIPSFTDRGESFEEHARESVYRGINDIAVETMVGLGMREAEAAGLSGQITDAFVAHYRGDEHFDGQEMIRLKGLSLMGSLVVGTRKDLVYGLWSDPEPVDNSISIDLTSGEWR